MEEKSKQSLPAPPEQVHLKQPIGRSVFRLLAFIVCLAILVAAFAVSEMWSSSDSAVGTWIKWLFHRGRTTQDLPEAITDAQQKDPEPETSVQDPSESQTPPDGAVSVFVRTQTLKEPVWERPDAASEWKLDLPEDGPSVLIVYTCPTEAYLAELTDRLDGTIGDITYSNDPSRCVTAVGEALRETLAANGIHAICATQTDGATTLKGSYERAALVIAEQLERYPSIRYVVDVRRDSILDANGNYIRTLAAGDGPATAQILAVVGSDRGGMECPAWRENLAFAEALGNLLNNECPSVFRGISLRNSPCNQQLSPRSIQLAVGSGGNTVEEAVCAARSVGKALAELFRE